MNFPAAFVAAAPVDDISTAAAKIGPLNALVPIILSGGAAVREHEIRWMREHGN